MLCCGRIYKDVLARVVLCLVRFEIYFLGADNFADP